MTTQFLKLAEIFQHLEDVSSSLTMIDILADFFPKLSPDEAKISAYLLAGEVSPASVGLEMGLADKMVVRAISRSEDVSVDKISSLFQKNGDLGIAVEYLRKTKRGKSLTIKEVFEKLTEIAKTSGEGSQGKKINLLSELLSSSSGLEAKYIVRTILGTLRLGVGEMTFLYGLAKAFLGDKKKKLVLEHAFNVVSDLGEVAYNVSKLGIKGVSKIEPKVGVPIRMMLASRIEEFNEVKKHIKGDLSVEEKYDGERIQTHIKSDNEVVLFSRRQENITHQYPDIVEGLKKSFDGKNIILEGEVVPYDEKRQRLLPFQILMSRRRKHEIAEYAQKIPVRYFLFDLLYVDGKSFLDKPLKERRKALEEAIKENKIIYLGKHIVTKDLSEIESFFSESLKRGTEGVMIKDWSGVYQAGTRGWLWIKFKKEYREELADTFDLTVVGGLYGAGRRAKTYGSLLAASYSPKENKYYSFTKVGTGFTDEVLSHLPKMLDKYKLAEKHKLVETGMEADVWFEPKVVMEISGAEITVSPVHTVAKEKIKTGGLALRFPKFLRWREDKKPDDATTVEEIYKLYQSSKKK